MEGVVGKFCIFNLAPTFQTGWLVLACGSKIFSTQLVFQVPRRASRRFLGSLDALCRTDLLLGYRCVGGGGFLAEPRNLDLVEASVNGTWCPVIPHGCLQRFVTHHELLP